MVVSHLAILKWKFLTANHFADTFCIITLNFVEIVKLLQRCLIWHNFVEV